jgi:hypothetical protein
VCLQVLNTMVNFAVLTVQSSVQVMIQTHGFDDQQQPGVAPVLLLAALDGPQYLRAAILKKCQDTGVKICDAQQEQNKKNFVNSHLTFSPSQCALLSTSIFLRWITETKGWSLNGPPCIAAFDSGRQKTEMVFIFSDSLTPKQ